MPEESRRGALDKSGEPGYGASFFHPMRNVRIFCPKCEWVPQPADRWMCLPSCGCEWNTFETCGVCPGCGKDWKDTMCLACNGWSPHIEWYHEQALVEEKECAEAITAKAVA